MSILSKILTLRKSFIRYLLLSKSYLLYIYIIKFLYNNSNHFFVRTMNTSNNNSNSEMINNNHAKQEKKDLRNNSKEKKDINNQTTRKNVNLDENKFLNNSYLNFKVLSSSMTTTFKVKTTTIIYYKPVKV